MAYIVGDQVAVKIGKTLYSGEIKDISPQIAHPQGVRDLRCVTIAAKWSDMAGKEHTTDIKVPYWKLTARG